VKSLWNAKRQFVKKVSMLADMFEAGACTTRGFQTRVGLAVKDFSESMKTAKDYGTWRKKIQTQAKKEEEGNDTGRVHLESD
jgi:DNA-binding ferritin-like protein (Dps family)